MNGYVERLRREQRHLLEGPTCEERPAGMGTVRFLVKCRGDAWQVLANAKNVLTAMDHASLTSGPNESAWRLALPEWFVDTCAAEQTEQEAEAWLRWWKTLSPEEQAKVEQDKQWSLANWLYWMEPDNRKWFWWDAVDQDANTLLLAVEVDDWPFPWGALRWLFRAAGAESVDAES